jgi:hypothetical protein
MMKKGSGRQPKISNPSRGVSNILSPLVIGDLRSLTSVRAQTVTHKTHCDVDQVLVSGSILS